MRSLASLSDSSFDQRPKALAVHLMLMLALASAENMVAATPFREAIWWPTAASTQQSSIFSTLLMRPAPMASENLHKHWQYAVMGSDETTMIPHCLGCAFCGGCAVMQEMRGS